MFLTFSIHGFEDSYNNDGAELTYIAEKFKVSHDTIRSILKSMNIKIRNHGLDVNNVEAQEIITAYKEGLGIGFLARYYHTNFNVTSIIMDIQKAKERNTRCIIKKKVKI